VVWNACGGARQFIVDIVCRSLKRVVIDSDISLDSCDEQEPDHGKVRRKDTGKGRKTSSPLPANSEPSSSPSVVQSRPVLSGSLSSPAASSRPRPASSAGRSTGAIPAATAALSSVPLRNYLRMLMQQQWWILSKKPVFTILYSLICLSFLQ